MRRTTSLSCRPKPSSSSRALPGRSSEQSPGVSDRPNPRCLRSSTACGEHWPETPARSSVPRLHRGIDRTVSDAVTRSRLLAIGQRTRNPLHGSRPRGSTSVWRIPLEITPHCHASTRSPGAGVPVPRCFIARHCDLGEGVRVCGDVSELRVADGRSDALRDRVQRPAVARLCDRLARPERHGA
jgi:hypothetical protein